MKTTTRRYKLIQLRKARKLTQGEVADHLSISRQYYGMIEQGERTPPTPLGLAIARFFEVHPDEVFGPNEDSVEPMLRQAHA